MDLKRIVILAVVFFATWIYFTKESGMPEASPPAPAADHEKVHKTTVAPPKPRPKPKAPKYRCDGRQHCSQMTSYEEAVFFLEHCPNTKMDGDKDGIPCERQFLY